MGGESFRKRQECMKSARSADATVALEMTQRDYSPTVCEGFDSSEILIRQCTAESGEPQKSRTRGCPNRSYQMGVKCTSYAADTRDPPNRVGPRVPSATVVRCELVHLLSSTFAS